MTNKWAGYNALYAVEKEKARAAHDIKTSDALKAPDDTTLPERVQIAPADTKASGDIEAPHDIKTLDAGQWTAVPNGISDTIMGTLELSDQSILNRLYRLTWGFHRQTCKVSKESLARACNINARQVPRSTKRLAARGFIEIVGHDMDNPDKHERGTIYRMLLPKATVGIKSSGDIKARGNFKSSGGRVAPIKESFETKVIKEPTKEELEEFERARAELEGGSHEQLKGKGDDHRSDQS